MDSRPMWLALLWAIGFVVIAGACVVERLDTPVPTATVVSSGPDASGPQSSQLTLPSIADVAERAQPAVVSVLTEKVTLDMFFGRRLEEGQGSGVIFDEQGYILTNSHVVEGATEVQIALLDGRVFQGEVLGTDPPTDLAVVKIRGDDLPVAKLGSIADLRVGDWVVAIGNPLGVGISVTLGIVSALGRDITTPGNCQLQSVIQTDAAINPGNSGGPLLDLDGLVVGINTAIAQGAQGIGYSISIDQARPIIDYIIERGRVPGEPYIGIGYYPMSRAVARQFGLEVAEGLLVQRVVPDSAAERAGLRPGDVITQWDGERLRNREDLVTILEGRHVGDQGNLTVDRLGQTSNVSLRLGEKPRTCG